MQNSDDTIDHGTLKRLIDAGKRVVAEAIADTRGWGLVISHGRSSHTLAATRGKPRTFRQFETLAQYLKALGIVEYRVNIAKFERGSALSGPKDKRGATASSRMKQAHQAAEYDAWFRREVQASIDDPRPGVDDAQAKKTFAAKRAALVKLVGAAEKAVH